MICIQGSRRASSALLAQLDRLAVRSTPAQADAVRNSLTVTNSKYGPQSGATGADQASLSYKDGIITLDLLLGTGDQAEEAAARDLFKEEISTAAVKSIVLSSVALASVDPLVAFSNVIALNVSFNAIADVAPLSSLQFLRHLDVSHNKISDAKPLEGLVSLTVLRCHENQIASLDFIENMKNLEELCISHNLIEWESLIYFHCATELKSLVWYGNPFETKANYIDFALSFLPKLNCVDGMPVTPQIWNPGFLGTPDGRVMLTQSKALLSKSGRERFAQSKFNLTMTMGADNMKYKIKPKILKTTNVGATRRAKRSDDLDTSGLLLRSHDMDSIDELKLSGSNTIATSSDALPGDRSVSAEGSSASIAKSLLSSEAPPRLGLVKTSAMGMGGQSSKGGGKPKGKGMDNSKRTGDGSIRSNVADQSDGQDLVARSSIEGGSKEATSVRFGNASTPVAVCIYPSGGGYVRWAPSGTIACSYEPGGQLFCAHKTNNASMAVVVSGDGSGSVMDENGACLMSISKDRKVVLFDVSGSKICEFSTMVTGTIISPGSPQASRDGDSNTKNKAASSQEKRIITYENGSYRIGGEDCRPELSRAAADSIEFCKSYSFHWAFRSLQVFYHLDNLEMKVIVNNGRAECVFSNLTGASVTKVFPTKAELRESMLKNRAERRREDAISNFATGDSRDKTGGIGTGISESSKEATDVMSPKATGRTATSQIQSPASTGQAPTAASNRPHVQQDAGKAGLGATRKALQRNKKGRGDEDAPLELLSAEEHERLRNGLASIMSEMNNILASATKK